MNKANNQPKQAVAALNDYRGEVVFTIGKSAYYYFMIYNTSYNWDNNPQTWQQAISSLGIDK